MDQLLMQIENYVKPELLVLIPALYILGYIFKNAEKIKDKDIPLFLGIVGVVLSALWVLATSPIANYQDALMAIFTAIIQGLLVTGGSVYASQLQIQAKKED